MGKGGPRRVTGPRTTGGLVGRLLQKVSSVEEYTEYPMELHYQGRIHKFNVVRVCARV